MIDFLLRTVLHISLRIIYSYITKIVENEVSKKLNSIVFYCNFNNGDCHVVRNLIKYVMKTFPGLEYKLRHPNNPKILKDLHIPTYWNNYIDLNNMRLKFDYRGYYQEYGVLYFNFQALCHDRQFFKDSFTINTFYNIFAKTLWDIFKHKMPERILDFLPQIDYSCYEIGNIKKLDMRGINVLVCNNDPQSEQATKFDMDVLMNQIVSKYSNTTFYLTNKNKTEITGDNVRYVSDITGNIGNDLNEISYLSTKCDVIIGRYSGPHTFCYVRETLLNQVISFITFSPPSTLYGMNPNEWCDFGVSKLTDEHANFYNIPDNNDEIRHAKVCSILEKIGCD